MGLDVNRIGSILFYLLSEVSHGHSQGCHAAAPVVAPDFCGEIAVGHDLAHVFGKEI